MTRPAAFDGYAAAAGLLLMDEVSQPFQVHGPFGALTIAESGYSWLELAPAEACVFVTAQFDASDRLFQIYFDVTSSAGNDLTDAEDPTFEDALLDVVWDPFHGIAELDRAELDEALRSGLISQAEHDHAACVCSRLKAYLCDRGAALADYCRELQRRMKAELTQDGKSAQ